MSKAKKTSAKRSESKGKEPAHEGAQECVVCTEPFDTTRHAQIRCPFCEEGKASACRECSQRYLLDSVHEPHCMSCRHDWGIVFFMQAFPKSFVVGAYRKSRQAKAVEREKGRLAEAMPYVEARKLKVTLLVEVREHRREISRLKGELHRKERLLKEIERGAIGTDGVPVGASEAAMKAQYLFRCPVGDCKGLVESATWKCALCDSALCRKCHAVQGKVEPGAKEAKHQCKEDDVESAKATMRDTKACPKCAARIYKIDGCDQMYCTACHTPFSWKSGQVVTGTIHNPHYYELQRRLGGDAPRVVGDVPCGGVPGWNDLMRVTRDVGDAREKRLDNALGDVHRLVGEVNDALVARGPFARLEIKESLDVRVAYLAGELDEKGFKHRLFVRQRHNDKIREVRNVLETFRATMSSASTTSSRGTRISCTSRRAGAS